MRVCNAIESCMFKNYFNRIEHHQFHQIDNIQLCRVGFYLNKITPEDPVRVKKALGVSYLIDYCNLYDIEIIDKLLSE